jgi:predicted transposase/invertase (TIGR01784 family)
LAYTALPFCQNTLPLGRVRSLGGLRELSNELDKAALKRVLGVLGQKEKAAQISAYLDVLVRANLAVTEEVMMSEKALTLEGVLKKAGYTDLWIKQGVEQGFSQGISQGISQGKDIAKAEVARNLVAEGLAEEKIARITGLSLEKIRELSAN